MIWQAASQESGERFAERVTAAASEEERQEFVFRVLAKRPRRYCMNRAPHICPA